MKCLIMAFGDTEGFPSCAINAIAGFKAERGSVPGRTANAPDENRNRDSGLGQEIAGREITGNRNPQQRGY
jgi:hypothetical protein